MIALIDIPSGDLNDSIKRLDENISYVDSEFDIELKSYGNILRVSINAIQKESIKNLIERLSINKELENGLDNAGGYTIEFLGEKNPKKELIAILNYLKDDLPKQQVLIQFLNAIEKKTIAISDNNDLTFISQHIRNRKVEIMPFSVFKRTAPQNKTVVFHSFNGQKDFDYFYNLKNEVALILYQQEKILFDKYLDHRKRLIETELKSIDRFKICNIEYTEAIINEIDISTTINGIVSRLDEMSNRAYEGYKNESDLLLNEIEEKLLYKIESDLMSFFLESNDTVFTDKGDLMKSYKIKVGDKIRIYPKLQLAENLYQVAVETEPEVFGKVEEHANLWRLHINDLRNKFGDDALYQKLKEKGLRVLPGTLATYGKGFRKFPMFKNDLRAIFKLYYQEKSDNEIDLIIKPIFKSKTTYNSTMIVLGRGLKQELRLFLKENRVGEILLKRNLNATTLQTFIDENMPIHTVISKEIFNDNIETLEETTLHQIEI